MTKYLWLVFVCLPLASVTAATLTVDPNSNAPGVFATIGAAADAAGPGDVVLVHRGVYREHVAPVRGGTEEAPLIFRAAHPGEVIVKGSEIWRPELTALPGETRVFTTPLPADDWIGDYPNPYKRRLNAAGSDRKAPARPAAAEQQLLPYTLGQIFCDGVELRQAQTEAEVRRVPGSWIVTQDGDSLLLHLPTDADPSMSVLELTVRDRVFAPARRGLGYIHLEGFVFEHCANQAPFPQLGMVSTRSGHHWIIRDNVIRHAKTVGLDIGSEYWNGTRIDKTLPEDQPLMRKGGYHLVTGNTVVDNGLCGIAGWSCKGSVIRENRIECNNNLSLSTLECEWEEWGGIKLHEAEGARIEGNLVRFNGAHGIWLDNGYNNARITRNVVFGNIGTGVFIELGAGSVIIDHNIIANTTPFTGYYPGRGIYAHDASGVKIYHNLVMNNAEDAVFMHRVTDRKYQGKPVETSEESILNNIFYRNGGGVSLPYPGDASHNCISDRNLFVGPVAFRYSQGADWPAILTLAARHLNESELAAATTLRRFQPVHWPTLSGRESESQFWNEGQFEIRIKPFEPSLYIFDRTNHEWALDPISGLDRDFNGSPMPGKVKPGPFQNLQKKSDYRLMYPIPDYTLAFQ